MKYRRITARNLFYLSELIMTEASFDRAGYFAPSVRKAGVTTADISPPEAEQQTIHHLPD